MDFVRFNGRYRLREEIGSGSFGELYLARDILLAQDVVIKLEPLKARQRFLEHEYHVYRKLSGGIGIPHVRWFGTERGFDAMAMDRLGSSLEDILARCHFRFTLKTVLLLANQLVCRLKYIHSRNFIHRDLKPSNIVMGVGKQATVVYLIDFGLAKEYREPDTYRHIPLNTNLGLTGTATFASINSHLGLELGRRDDLESLAYILIYFLRGSLPWQGLHNVTDCKQRTSPRDLCCELPTEFSTFLEYCRSLGFEEKPDYGYISDLFGGLLSREGFQDDATFDWDDGKNTQLHSHSTSRNANAGTVDQSPKRREGLRSQSRRRQALVCCASPRTTPTLC